MEPYGAYKTWSKEKKLALVKMQWSVLKIYTKPLLWLLLMASPPASVFEVLIYGVFKQLLAQNALERGTQSQYIYN